ncbi:hypothetical protein [Streptomyces sp. NPDC002463]|uniref:hypothetical protein n=1 Tax=Streptomyces sp. NPDC002463 TaxID=3364645 RepID=UPI0036B47E79
MIRDPPVVSKALARAARIDRSFLHRHRDLHDALHTAAHEPVSPAGTGPAVTRASLQADPVNTDARSVRLAECVHQLEDHLSKALSEESRWTSGLGAPADVADLSSRLTRLEQRNVELSRALEER